MSLRKGQNVILQPNMYTGLSLTIHRDFIEKAFDAPCVQLSHWLCVVCSVTLNWQHGKQLAISSIESERAVCWLRLTSDDVQGADMVPIMHLGTISLIYLIKYKKQEHRLTKNVTNVLLFKIFLEKYRFSFSKFWLQLLSNSIHKRLD